MKQRVSIAEGTGRILAALRKLGAYGDPIISTNLDLRSDGLPRSGQRDPDDPGAAVYWQTDRRAHHRVMAIDHYDRTADNLAAIAATLEALRAIARHGGAQILDRAFTGFAALPAPKGWREVFGVVGVPTPETVRSRYRALAKQRHPDAGGSQAAMAELNSAYQQAQHELELAE